LGDGTEVVEEVEDVQALKKEIETLKQRLNTARITGDQAEEQRNEAQQFIRDFFRMDYDDIYEDMKRDLIEEGYKGEVFG
jgi:SMC interacting uncharacterized protein involved in chromosome segregation